MCESRKISSLETKRKPAFKDWNSIWKWLSQKKRRENTSLCWTVTAAPVLYIEGSCFSPWHLHVNGSLVLGDSREGPQVASLEIWWWLERQYGTWWASVLILYKIALCTSCSVIMDVTFLLLPQCFMVLLFSFQACFLSCLVQTALPKWTCGRYPLIYRHKKYVFLFLGCLFWGETVTWW